MTEQHQDQPQAWTPPRFLPPAEPLRRADGSRHYPGISYATLPGYRPLKLDLWVPEGEGPHPVVVFVHGGAWALGDRGDLLPAQDTSAVIDLLLAADLAVASIDYRLSREATFPAQLHDTKSAVRYLRRHADQLGLDSSRTAVWGESAGAHLAALLALTADRVELAGNIGVTGPDSTVVAAVGWYGIYDLAALPTFVLPPDITLPADTAQDLIEQLLGGVADPELAMPASPVTYVTAAAPPFLLIHGTADRLVPFEQSLLLEKSLLAHSAEVQLVPVDDADHGLFGAPELATLLQQTVAFLSTHLREENR
ncbi:alpha/beta hydrolase fold domain-containing protein [Streptomyces canus]|uniref:alpha/beta hydrolase fold domain-containing protein n=1 Tax=Streptomyces TaxID=1883 RepID=UPI003648806A